MPVINLGVDYNQAKTESDKQKERLPEGPCKVICKDIEAVMSKKNTPQLKWTLESIENPNPDLNGKSVMTWTPLPYEGNTKGIGFLVDITTAFGKPWEGSEIDTDQYIGKTCVVNLAKDDKGYVNIKSYGG